MALDLPFSSQEFFAVFARYNRAVWPLPIALPIAAAVGAVGIGWRPERCMRGVMLLLSALWLWMALAYHWTFFRPLNPAAAAFAVLFGIQAVLLLVTAWRGTGGVMARLDTAAITGISLVLYALLLYPVIGYALGQRYPAIPTFGLPCPTTLYTIGVLLWSGTRRTSLFVIPALWSLLGLSAALQLGVYEDLLLPVAGIGALVFALLAGRTPARMSLSS